MCKVLGPAPGRRPSLPGKTKHHKGIYTEKDPYRIDSHQKCSSSGTEGQSEREQMPEAVNTSDIDTHSALPTCGTITGINPKARSASCRPMSAKEAMHMISP